MKRLIVLTVCLIIMLSVSLAFSFTGTPVPGSGINGTAHDIPHGAGIPAGYLNGADPLNRICIYCHAPHHTYKPLNEARGTGYAITNPDVSYLPLWNHEITARNGVQWVPYTNDVDEPLQGPKRSQAIDTFVKIGSVSLLCLSCHDGSIGVNSYGNDNQNFRSQGPLGGMNMSDAAANVEYNIGKGGYLGNHHPVGFPYDAALSVADPEIADITTVNFTLSNGTLKPVADLLWNGNMECGTCHAVHNTGNSGEMLLYVSDRNSNLCLTCHLKGLPDQTGVVDGAAAW